MSYVLFKQGRLPGRGATDELYVRGVEAVGKPNITEFPRLAMAFMTADDAYKFGTKFALDDWQVGVR